MLRRIFNLLCFLLVLTLISGYSGKGTVPTIDAPPSPEISSSPNQENSDLDQNAENEAVSETGTSSPKKISSIQNNESSNPDPNAESGGDMTKAGSQQNLIYLWEKGNIPTTTVYTENPNSSYFDPPVFRPHMMYFPASQDVAIKGAVLICPGGAFQFHSDSEGAPVAKAFSELGYQSFVVNYRLRPYSMQEGALDLGRAVRYVRQHAKDYGIEELDIAVIGFSAGGILWGELLLNFDGTVNGTSIDPDYVPDELDQVSADASAVGMIYSFYGRLSVASTDVEKFMNSDLPPAFFAYGTRVPFVGEFEECIEALRQAGVPVEDHVLQGWPHGFGVGDGQWIKDFDHWVTNIFENN
jgi:acetyl esterase/lipase